MLRTALWTLGQRRYAALAALMVVVALICVAAGTWQVSRYEQSVRDNDALDRNAHASAVPLTTALVPLIGYGSSPGRDAIRFRTVTAAGTYIATAQQLVRNESVNGVSDYYVLDPLRNAAGVLLVVRGFVAGDVASNGTSTPPATITAPPAGVVQIAGHLQTTGTKNDGASELGNSEIESINPGEQAARLRAPVYDTYATLTSGQPGTSGVSVLPEPDLSNPAGGAYEWQHFAYIIQWYLFALLALATPFAISRTEVRDAQQRFLGIDPASEELGLERGAEPADQLQLSAGPSSGVAVAVRNDGTVAARSAPTPQWQRAARLADRHGRSLGIGPGATAEPTGQIDHGRQDGQPRQAAVFDSHDIPNSATQPHHSNDAYHGSYNDYLWELGLADGAIPPVSARRIEETHDRLRAIQPEQIAAQRSFTAEDTDSPPTDDESSSTDG